MRPYAILVIVPLLGPCLGSETRFSMRARGAAKLPDGWTAVAPPRDTTGLYEVAECVSPFASGWAVALSRDSSTLVISRDPSWHDADTAFVDGGRLVSADGGEFGGDVVWEPESGERQRVASMNLRTFVPTARGLMGLEGLAHMTYNQGHLVRFERGGTGTWTVTPLLDLGAAPHAYAATTGDTLLVATTAALLLVM